MKCTVRILLVITAMLIGLPAAQAVYVVASHDDAGNSIMTRYANDFTVLATGGAANTAVNDLDATFSGGVASNKTVGGDVALGLFDANLNNYYGNPGGWTGALVGGPYLSQTVLANDNIVFARPNGVNSDVFQYNTNISYVNKVTLGGAVLDMKPFSNGDLLVARTVGTDTGLKRYVNGLETSVADAVLGQIMLAVEVLSDDSIVVARSYGESDSQLMFYDSSLNFQGSTILGGAVLDIDAGDGSFAVARSIGTSDFGVLEYANSGGSAIATHIVGAGGPFEDLAFLDDGSVVVSRSISGGSQLMNYKDNVQLGTLAVDYVDGLVSVVPEPATFALLGFGGLMSFIRRRK